ncbi:MAG: ArnT family glycosyltransferase [Thermoguttaceae bacterium]
MQDNSLNRSFSWHPLWIVLLASVVFFANLGVPRLWDRDEPRNAGCAAEMLERGDWVVPVFNAELRVHKPVLLYWFMMSAYAVFGQGEFGARFWSALLGVGTVWMTYVIGKRLFGREVGFWSGLVLATTMMFTVAARAATPDSVLIFFTTLATMIYVKAAFPEAADRNPADGERPEAPAGWGWYPRHWGVVALMYGVLGFAVLAKGPVGLVLPTACIGMFLLIMRLPRVPESHEGKAAWWVRVPLKLLRPFAPLHFLRTCWFMRPLTAVAACLAVALPWYIWVGLRTDGAWLEGFLLEHNLGRAMNAMEGHRGPIFYYVIAILVGFFPWSVFFAPVLVDASHRIREDHPWKPGLVLAACWAGVYLGLFSLAKTKLPSYITPAYPAVALLTGCFLYQYRRGEAWGPVGLAKMATGICIGVGIVTLIAVPIAAHFFLPGEAWLGLMGLVPIAGGGVARYLQAKGRWRPVVTVYAATAAVFLVAMMALAPVRVDRHQTFDRILESIARNSRAPRIASFACMEPSWVFYSGRSIHEYGRKEVAEVRAFLEGDDALVITTAEAYARVQQALPGDVEVLTSVDKFLDDDRLVLLGRKAGGTVAVKPSEGAALR